MTDLLDLLKGQLSGNVVNQLSDRIGARREQTSVASKSLISGLLGGLVQNVMQGQDRAQSLNNALDRDHDGSILEDLAGFLSGKRSPSNTKMLDGRGIVNHTLNPQQQEQLLNNTSRMSGIGKDDLGKLLISLAPVVMGALGREKRQRGLDSGGITSMLTDMLNGGTRRSNQNLTSSLLNSFLDQDRDGSTMDDVAGIGLKLLGNFFR